MTVTKNQSQAYHHGNLRRVLIDTAVEIISEQGAKDLSFYRVMFGTRAENSYFSDELKPESIPVFKLLRDIIMVCQKKDLLKAGDPQEMAIAAWSIVHGFAMLRIDHHIPAQGMDEKKLRELQRSVVLTLYFGLRPE